VRTVHVYYGPGQPWDDHSKINKNLTERCPDMIRLGGAGEGFEAARAAGRDAVVWGGEFGRTPVSEKRRRGGTIIRTATRCGWRAAE